MKQLLAARRPVFVPQGLLRVTGNGGGGAGGGGGGVDRGVAGLVLVPVFGQLAVVVPAS